MKVFLVFVSLWFTFANSQETEEDKLFENNSRAFIGIHLPGCVATEKPTFLPYVGDCSKYYKCIGGWAYAINCPSGLIYDPNYGGCQWESEANCDYSTGHPPPPGFTTTPSSGHTWFPSRPTPTSEPIGKPMAECQANKTSCIELPFPGDCSKFYKCKDGNAYLMVCPNGLEWNQKINMCDWPTSAGCSIKPICPSNVNPNITINVPYPGNCSKYYICLHGHEYEASCSIGLEWSVEFNRCDWPCVAQCVIAPGPTTTTTTTTPKPPHCPSGGIENCNCPAKDEPKHPVQLPYPGDCTKYYKCFRGLAYVLSCRNGLIFDAEKSRCDLPWVAHCKTTTCKDGVRNEKCPLNENIMNSTVLPYPGNCSKYYQCQYGIACPKDCSNGQEWSASLKRCEWPWIAQCSTSCKDGVRNENCPLYEESSKPTLLPYPGNCSKYNKCLHGIACPVDCPNGKEWSTSSKCCEWPWVAQCSTNCKDGVRNENCPLFEEPSNPTLLPYPGNCSKYNKCLHGIACPVDCPNGKEWSTSSKCCEWPWVAQCSTNCKDGVRNEKCPLYEDPSNPTLLPYPGNCSKYYQCKYGIACPKNCKSGQEWSASLKRCDSPWVAQCSTNCKDGVRNENCPLYEDPSKPTFLPNQGNCSKYYQCRYGIACPVDCPKGKEWSTLTKCCEWPWVAQCSTNCKDGVKNENCPLYEDPSNPTLLPYPGNCSKYYQCRYGKACPKNCKSGQEWSASLKRCDSPWVAQCSTNCKDGVRNENCPLYEDPSKPTFLPNQGNCSKYYQCRYGIACPVDCPNGKEFSTLTKCCEWPWIAQCSTICKNGVRNENCPLYEDPSKPTLLPYQGNCSKYYQCTSGVACPMDCPCGQEWSEIIKNCDLASFAQCKATESCKDGVVHPNCPPNEDPMNPTQLPYPGNCSKFYKCSFGVACPQNCPGILEWSVSLNRCDWPANAQCSGSVTSTPATPSPATPPTASPPTPNCIDEDLYPYPGDCTKYYQCSNGVPYVHKCASNLYWDNTAKLCNWSNLVKCEY